MEIIRLTIGYPLGLGICIAMIVGIMMCFWSYVQNRNEKQAYLKLKNKI